MFHCCPFKLCIVRFFLRTVLLAVRQYQFLLLTTTSKYNNKISRNWVRKIYFLSILPLNLVRITFHSIANFLLQLLTHFYGWHTDPNFKNGTFKHILEVLFLTCSCGCIDSSNTAKSSMVSHCLHSHSSFQNWRWDPIKSQDLWSFYEYMLMSLWIFILNAFAIYCARVQTCLLHKIMIHRNEIHSTI